jgi:hypothetical protein
MFEMLANFFHKFYQGLHYFSNLAKKMDCGPGTRVVHKFAYIPLRQLVAKILCYLMLNSIDTKEEKMSLILTNETTRELKKPPYYRGHYLLSREKVPPRSLARRRVRVHVGAVVPFVVSS